MPTKSEYRIDKEEFLEWCNQQIEYSRSITSRIIVDGDDEIRFRLREGESVEDIVLHRGKDVDTIRFEKDGETRQFHGHRRDFSFHEKTLIVRHSNGNEICRAGTGTKNKKGPFPV